MPKIKDIRSSSGFDSITQYNQIEVSDLQKYQNIDILRKTREVYWPLRDDRSSCESHIIQISKPDLVLKTMNDNPFQTNKFGWIDSNLGPGNFSKISENYQDGMFINVLNNLTDKFHIQVLNVCDKKFKNANSKHEMFLEYRWIVCGCLFTMTQDIGTRIMNRLNEVIMESTLKGLGHGEEMFFLEILDEFYDDIHRSYGDYHHILNNFIKPTTGFRYIHDLIVKNYKNRDYNKECCDCSQAIIDVIESDPNVKIDSDVYFSILFNYYLAAFYHKGKEEARNIVNFIMNKVRTDPGARKEYEKNFVFYGDNFEYALR
jgi:hypothetical protein